MLLELASAAMPLAEAEDCLVCLAEESEIGSSDRDVAQSDMDWPARCAQFGRRGMRNSGTR